MAFTTHPNIVTTQRKLHRDRTSENYRLSIVKTQSYTVWNNIQSHNIILIHDKIHLKRLYCFRIAVTGQKLVAS